jgi:hypothetical protein
LIIGDRILLPGSLAFGNVYCHATWGER